MRWKLLSPGLVFFLALASCGSGTEGPAPTGGTSGSGGAVGGKGGNAPSGGSGAIGALLPAAP